MGTRVFVYMCEREKERRRGAGRGDERFRVLKIEEGWYVAAFHLANWEPLKVACKGSVAGVLLLIYLW